LNNSYAWVGMGRERLGSERIPSFPVKILNSEVDFLPKYLWFIGNKIDFLLLMGKGISRRFLCGKYANLSSYHWLRMIPQNQWVKL
ncbi:MAG: hypothetical protein NW237_15790, partial [Cyanobacteriota bacterium]|nr:hypothetical protein [Cyanobacteriota bacterium]